MKRTMNVVPQAALAAALALAIGTLAACGPSYAERRKAVDAEWAITNARADEINAEYMRRMEEASTPEERNAAIDWRAEELEKIFADHDARRGANAPD